MATDPIALNICDQKTLTVLSRYEWQSDSFTIWDIVNSVWFEVTDKKWWDILEHNLRVTSNASGQWYINVHTLDIISNFHALYKYVEPEIVESFFLDWVKYQLWWWDEAIWWNITWTLSDQTDLQNALNSKQNTLTAGENIKISSNVISANNVFIITEDDVTVSTTQEYWVAPYNTSYYYTNIDISASAGIEWREWAIYTFVVNTEMVVASAYRNVRVKIWTWTYIPVMWTTAALAGHSYFTKTNIRQFQYTTKYESWWALHLFTDSNTTYKAMTEAQATAWTATTALTISPAILKWAIQTHAVNDTAYASSWNWVTTQAPSKNAVYDKLNAMDTTISWKQNTLTTQTAYTSKWSATKVPQITTNTLWQVTGITEVNITHPSQVDDTAYASSWNGVTSIAPSKNAVYDKISAMDTTISWKQDALTAQTAYTSKWTSSKVPQITTNTLWQVTWITEVDINYPSQIDNTAYWSSWNGVTNKAPTKDAVYDKINAIDWQIADLQAHWKFLSLWNSATWLPISFPLTTPYTYSTWDYYMVETLPSSGSKYMPNGSSYSGTASTTVDSVNEVKVWDMYIYDGSTWLYASNHWKDVTFSNIAWNPSDNTNLATALNGKQDKLSAQTAYTSKGTASKVPQITTNTLWQVTGITEVDISYPSQVSDVAYASSWNWVTTVAPSKNVVYDKINAMDTIIAGKQDALTTQTAYTSKGTSTKVPTITTNTLGQVTGITETSIAFPVTSVNGNTGAITWLANASDVLTKTNTTSFTPTGDYQPATKKYVDDNKTEYNAGEWIGIWTVQDYSAMQWPAPDGFHVPLNTERQAVYNIWTALGWWSSGWTNFWIALKLPFAGYRSYSSADVSIQGTTGLYWSSSRNNVNNAYYLYFNSSNIIPQNTRYCAAGLSIRCFKDKPTIPTSSWTKLYWTSIEAGWIFWSSTDWLISLSSDWTTWITISDKNLWATTVWNSGDTLSEANCGKYYQWWNNYWFPRTWSVTTSSTQVDASVYGPGNYYSSNTFITYSWAWDSTDNANLRWWETWVVTLNNAITNTGVLSVNGQTWDVTLTAWDMFYSDFNAVVKTWATVTMDLFSTITPSANFTVNAPSTIKEGQTYILRVTNESTAYTMTLWTNMTNPFETDLTLTDYWVDQFVFLAVDGKLELQPEWGGGWWWGWAITADTTWTETSISKIWVWTEEEYANLWTYEENVAYMTY